MAVNAKASPPRHCLSFLHQLLSNVAVVTRPLASPPRKLQEFGNLALRPGASLKECECWGLDVVLLLLIADAAPEV